jgi:tRNA nucleotidyltransferase/poly(A) polymerase
MSDYMFMLESHLSTEQNRVLAEVQAAAAEANLSLFLTGGAMRDMLAGQPIRDLDFTVEGDAAKLAASLAKRPGAEVVEQDAARSTTDLRFPGDVTVQVGMARKESYPKPGGKVHVMPVTIHEDLRCRDFTVNAIALSLNRASRGLLIDPTNGLGDVERKELRAAYNYAFYDDPTRILRLIRLRARLGFAVDERTWSQYENARAEKMEEKVPPRRLFEELRQIAYDPNVTEIVKALDEQKLLTLFSPAFTGPKVNVAGLTKLQKARQTVPAGVKFPVENLGLFLFFLTEKLTPKEKAALVKATAMRKAELELWQGLEGRAKKLERELKAAKLNRPSLVYNAGIKAAGDEILFLLARTQLRLVQDRLRNYLQKYLPMAQEVTEEEVKATGVQPGSPKWEKARAEVIAAKLNARPKKPAPVPEEAPPPAPPPGPAPLRRAYQRQPTARG